MRKKLVCRLWGPSEHARDDVGGTEVLVVRCGHEAKESLLARFAGTVFETPHYHGHNAVLIRLAHADAGLVAELLEHSYRTVAPVTLVRQLDP